MKVINKMVPSIKAVGSVACCDKLNDLFEKTYPDSGGFFFVRADYIHIEYNSGFNHSEFLGLILLLFKDYICLWNYDNGPTIHPKYPMTWKEVFNELNKYNDFKNLKVIFEN